MQKIKKYNQIFLLIMMSVSFQALNSDVAPIALGEGININSSGTVQITVQANVVSSEDIANSVVGRDNTGSFKSNMIQLDGNPAYPKDVATKQYVDLIASLGLRPKTPAIAAASTNSPITGLYAIDGIALNTNDRVLLTGQNNGIQNGLWLAQAGEWSRPADFVSGAQAGMTYVLITEGHSCDGSSWICNTSTAIIDTDPLVFMPFTLPSQTTGANVGIGVGQVYQGKDGLTLDFKTIAAGLHVLVANNPDDITLATDATSDNTNGTIVARDDQGSFNANNITANSFTGSLTGNVTGNVSGVMTGALLGNVIGDVSGVVTGSLVGNASTATSATTATSANTATSFTGSLVGDVTGTQSATVVSTVGGVSAANIVTGASLANAATNLNTNNALVKRDNTGNFAAGTITATCFSGPLTGNVIGNVSGVVTGSLVGNASTATSATSATSSATADSATSFTGSLAGDVTGTQIATVVNSVGGVSASSVATGVNSANAATNLNTVSTIVKRDTSGNFAAGTITATCFSGPLTGNVIGNVSGVVTGSLVGNASTATSATNNVLKSGDTMTGNLVLPIGSAGNPSLSFAGNTTTGISVINPNTLSFDANGTEMMCITGSAINALGKLIVSNLFCNQAEQLVTPTNNGSVTASATTSILILKNTSNVNGGYTINFPANPTDGQFFTIMLGTASSVTNITNVGGTGGAAIVNGLTSLTANGSSAVTYYYSLTANTWYRFCKG